MAKKIETPGVLKRLSDSEPLILVGEPKRIRGKLNLTNTGAEEVIIQNAHLRTAQAGVVPGRKAAQKPRLEISQPLQPIIVRPGRSRNVSVKMALDPYTPPGEYDAELEVSGEVMFMSDRGDQPDRFAIVSVEGILSPLIVPTEHLRSSGDTMSNGNSQPDKSCRR
jgi:hypothetical protein